MRITVVEVYQNGIPRLAAFMNSSDNTAIFRKFGQLSSRILLQHQIEITKLEKKLLDLDTADAANPHMHYRLHRTDHREGWDTAQRDLLALLEIKLKEYGYFQHPANIWGGQWLTSRSGDLLVRHATISRLGQARQSDHQSVSNWLWNNKPLSEGEDDFILHAEDMVSVIGHKSRFEDWIVSYLGHFPGSNVKVCTCPSLPP